MTDVLIVGAGPTGLVLAHELQRRNIEFRLIDAREGPEAYSRAMGIQSHTLEVLEKIGVLPTFLEKGRKAQEFSFLWNKKTLTFSLKNLDAPHPYVLILPQSETEAILRKNLKVEWKTRLIDLNTLELPSGEKEEVSFPWIVGCDGAHSSVRHALEMPFRGSKLEEPFLLADIKVHTSFDFKGPFIFLSKKGFGLLIPYPLENTFRVVLPGLHEANTPQKLTALIKERGFSHPLEVTEISILSSFQIQRRHAAKFRKNHVFLAGDAAHVHSPFGGQGMNTSIQDAFNLGWKLALVIKGGAPETLLDTYEAERLPVAKMVLKGTTWMTRLLTFSQKRCPPLFYWVFRFLLGSQKRRKKMGELISEIGISYAMNPINYELLRDKDWKGPKSGMRAPDCPLANGSRLFERLKSPKFVLLLFSKDPAFEEAIKEEYSEWIEVQVVKGEAIRQKYAAGTKSLYLIRPDGYIGYRSQSFKTEEVVSYLLKILHPALLRNKS